MADAREETASLLSAAHWLREASSLRAELPRPSFVLSLEEQLRADLSLLPPERSASVRALPERARLVAFAAALGLACAGAILVSRSQPGEAMYSLKRVVEAGYSQVMALGDHRVDRWLQLGSRRLDEVEWALANRPDLVHRLIDDTIVTYEAALDAARATGRHDLLVRAEAEAGEAADRLERLAAIADVASPPASVWLLVAARSLTRQLALGPGSSDGLEPPARGSPESPSSGRVGDVPVVPAAGLATPTASAPSGSAPAPTRNAFLPASATPVLEATTIHAETPAAPRATDASFPAPVDPPFGPPAVSPAATPATPAVGTNTPDRWPMTTTPLPPVPIATLPGAGTVAPPDPSPKAQPTTAWPTEPGRSMPALP